MFPKHFLNYSLRFRCFSSNKTYFKPYFISFDKLIECRINYHKNVVLNVRPFCDKIKNDFNQKSNENQLKSFEKQNETPMEITGKTLPKTSDFFYIILKKPNELMEWVAKTPPEKKKNVIFSAIISYLIKPMGLLGLVIIGYSFFHSEENPITGRGCVYSVPKELVDDIENDIFKEIFTQNMTSGTFLPSTDPLVKRLDNVFDKLIESNNDLDVIGDGIWTPVVINDDQICDIIVLKHSGNVFVYKKLLELCENDDELAYVLSHQLSHVMLAHIREPMTYAPFFFAPLLAYFTQMWAFGRDPALHFDILSKLDNFFEEITKKFIRKALSVSPYTEELEEEADRIAMQLMTRACFDIRKCRQFCKKHKTLSETNSKSKDKNQNNETIGNDFFIKHPITEQKLLYLFQYIKPFIELRKKCKCEPLV